MQGVWLIFSITMFVEILVFHANSVDPDQTPRNAASDLRLHCWPIFLLWDEERLIWVYVVGQLSFHGTLGINAPVLVN